jgi:hypothetical protein
MSLHGVGPVLQNQEAVPQSVAPRRAILRESVILNFRPTSHCREAQNIGDIGELGKRVLVKARH